MPWFRLLASRIRGLFFKRHLERELDEELRAHIEMATDGAGGLLSIRGDVTYKSQPTTRYPDFTRVPKL